jgi:hypothetical protein
MTDDDSRQIGRIFKPQQDLSLYFITEFKRNVLMFYGYTFDFQILAEQYRYYTVHPLINQIFASCHIFSRTKNVKRIFVRRMIYVGHVY